MNDLTLKYKSDTGKKRSDIELELKTNNGKISINTDDLYGDEFKRLDLSNRFLDAFEYQKEHDGETITIVDPEYVAWLESVD